MESQTLEVFLGIHPDFAGYVFPGLGIHVGDTLSVFQQGNFADPHACDLFFDWLGTVQNDAGSPLNELTGKRKAETL